MRKTTYMGQKICLAEIRHDCTVIRFCNNYCRFSTCTRPIIKFLTGIVNLGIDIAKLRSPFSSKKNNQDEHMGT